MTAPISYWEEIKRKLIHLSSLWIVAAIVALPRIFEHGRWICSGVLLFCLATTLILEHDYANGGKYLGKLYGKLFKKMLRTQIDHSFASSHLQRRSYSPSWDSTPRFSSAGNSPRSSRS